MRLARLRSSCDAVLTDRADAEEADHVLQSFRLRGQLFRGAGELLCASSISLRDQTNLTNGTVDLADSGGLFARTGSHLLHKVRSFLNRGDQFSEQPAGALSDLHV